MENYILCIYPLAILVILFWGCKIAKKGEFQEDFWSVSDSKNLQVAAAYGVILHHLTQLITKYGEVNKGPITIMSDMGILFTSVFFFYSGYGLMRSLSTKENYLDGFLYKRIMVILVPFLLTNILYLLPGMAEGRITNLYGVMTSIFGFTLMNTNAWFVIEILLFYFVFYLAFRFIRNKRAALVTLISFVFAIILTGLLLRHDTTRINGHWFRGEWWYNSTILFAVGLLFGKYRKKIVRVLKKGYKVLIPLSIAAFVGAFLLERDVRDAYGYYFETYTSMGYPEKIITLLAQMLLCIVFMLMLLLVTMKLRFDNFLLKKASTFSLELFLIHGLCMTNYSYEDEMPRFIMYGVTLIGATAAAVFLSFADRKIIEALHDYRSGKLDEYTTPERMAKQKRTKKYVKRGIYVSIALTRLLVVCFVLNLFDITVGEYEHFEEELVMINQAKVGSTVCYGQFDTDYLKDGTENLEWIVVEEKQDRVLLLSKYALFGYYYNQKHKKTAYQYSDIRELLVNEGYYELFSKGEREYMLPDEESGDYVFLLSAKQLEELNLTEDILIAKTTPMGERMGINMDGQDKHSWWWLRGDERDLYGPIVTSEGKISFGEKEVNRPTGGVRPAIWVKKTAKK
ncbi:MAG: acyltransferase family protein [Lachnospiraceae bacterium]